MDLQQEALRRRQRRQRRQRFGEEELRRSGQSAHAGQGQLSERLCGGRHFDI